MDAVDSGNQKIYIRSMLSGDLLFAGELSETEGWNQTERDWNFMISNSENYCRIVLFNKEKAGTGVLLNYNNTVAWICMILVRKEFRGNGLGGFLMQDLLKRAAGFPVIGLDATPAGKTIYEKFGFKACEKILRLSKSEIGSPDKLRMPQIEGKMSISEINQVIDFDKDVFGTSRGKLIKSLICNSPDLVKCIWTENNLKGFVLGRKGKKFMQIGPISALNDDVAIELLNKLNSFLQGHSVIIDVPEVKVSFLKTLESVGFSVIRSFDRMYLSEGQLLCKPENQFAIAGPEYA
jgi:GNAT superfamily N-acetyltransferase